MHCLNSLLSLRLLLIALTVVLLRRIYDEVERELSIDLKNLPPSLPIQWRTVDIENPPILNNSLYAKLRLNEFLAALQYRCNETLHFGDNSESFTVCGESGPIERVLIVTGNQLSSGKFERDLGATRWTVFLPEKNDLVEHLGGDVEVHYLTELHKWDRWATWDIEYAIRGRSYDVAKLELYAFQFQAYDQPRVNMTARHLALTINIDSGSQSSVTQVIGEWYQLLYWLFYSKRYALIGATSSGLCGQESQNCKYRVSMMRMDSAEFRSQLTAPVFGLGSPKEELNRLMTYLNASDCKHDSSESFPAFCAGTFTDKSKVALITYRELRSDSIPSSLSRLPNFHIITPWTTSDSTSLNTHHYAIGVSHKNETVDGLWKLDTLENLMTRIFGNSGIDLLMIDIKGGEVAIFPELLRMASKNKLNQLAIRGHLWSEENENFRQIYWSLRQMQNYGFTQRIGRVDLPHYDVVFERK
ncbi:hypothetical protein V3C99_004761 [Haemonchus contortus]